MNSVNDESPPPRPIQSAMDFGQRVAVERRARRMTQAHLAEEIGVDRKTIRQIESGGNARMHIVFSALAALGLAIKVEPTPPDLAHLENQIDVD